MKPTKLASAIAQSTNRRIETDKNGQPRLIIRIPAVFARQSKYTPKIEEEKQYLRELNNTNI
jgi:hypothetical protein